MKRRTGNFKKRSRRRRKIRFEIRRLESRQLLAGDIFFASDPQPMDIDFVGPVQVEAVEIISDAKLDQTCTETNSKSKDADSGDCAIVQDEIRGSIVSFPDSLFSVVGSSTRNKAAYGDGFEDGFGFFDRNITNDSATPTSSVEEASGQPEPAPISIVSQEPIAETITVETPITAEPEEVVYFINETEKSPTGSDSTAELKNDISQRTGLLAQHQLFALISPGELGKSPTPQVATPVVGVTNPSGDFAGTRGQIDDGLSTSTSNPYGDTSNTFDSDRDPQYTPPAIDIRIDASSDANRDVNTGIGLGEVTGRKVSLTQSSMYRNATFSSLERLVRPIEENHQPTDSTGAVDSDSNDVQTDGDKKLARQIQIVESAVILIGLPSSRICREEADSNRKSFV